MGRERVARPRTQPSLQPGRWEGPGAARALGSPEVQGAYTPHTYLLEKLPQCLLAVNGAPAGERTVVILPVPVQKGSHTPAQLCTR